MAEPKLTKINYADDASIKSRLRVVVRDQHKLKDKFGLTDVNLLNLTGGIPLPGLDFDFLAVTKPDDVVKTYLNFGNSTVQRTIDFKNKIIQNDLMDVEDKGQGTGTNLFLNQVIEAGKLGFTRLELWAADGPDFDGYYRWARVGYQMEKEDQALFEAWAEQNGITAKTVGELVKTDEGYELWKQKGFSWDGYFELADGSKSMNYLVDYLKRKGINIKL